MRPRVFLLRVLAQPHTSHSDTLHKEKLVFKPPGGNGYSPHYDGPSCALLGLASECITVAAAIDSY
eukprot:m.280644 g.280644  ORF g.280644 m.280644 type:complete len:66 (-) comp26974_c0_seq65:3060-3257(-)